MSDNVYMLEARQAKARKLAAALEQAGATADSVRDVDQAGRELAATYADVNVPSDDTWALVVAYFEGADRARAAVAGALPADPFEGVAP